MSKARQKEDRIQSISAWLIAQALGEVRLESVFSGFCERLERAELRWREDASNDDARFARNRVRALLPRLGRLGGPASLENLRAFGTMAGVPRQIRPGAAGPPSGTNEYLALPRHISAAAGKR